MKNAWWTRKSEQLQEAADRKDSTTFCELLKAVCGPKTNGTSPVLDSDGETIITDKDEVLDR